MLAPRRFHYRHPYLITLFRDCDEYRDRGNAERREKFPRVSECKDMVGMGHKVEDTYPTRTESLVMKKKKKKKKKNS
jgi:hypothetical protein